MKILRRDLAESHKEMCFGALGPSYRKLISGTAYLVKFRKKSVPIFKNVKQIACIVSRNKTSAATTYLERANCYLA